MTTAPFVSVVIATRNRCATLATTLAALDQQVWPRDRFEIVVADNGSTDGTRALLDARVVNRGHESHAPVLRVLSVETPGKSHAVNRALSACRGDVVALTDDDVRPEPDWIRRIADAFSETGADFIAGRILPAWEVPPPAWLSPALYGVVAVPDNGVRRIVVGGGDQRVMPIGANMAVARHVFETIGGLRTDLGKLDGSLRGGEDHEFFLRMLQAGYRGVYEPLAVVHHWVPASRLTRSYFRRWLYRNGRDVAILEPSFPATTARLLKLPRYLWRQAVSDAAAAAWATIWRNPRERCRASMRLLWFSGYVREAWWGPHRAVPVLQPGARRS
jgi:glycosyltransferase involved in cell wall biosynthesis